MTAPSKTNSRKASLRLSMRKMSSLLKYILYLPHHAVVQQHKTTTKLYVVYDASAKDDGPSLNECLYKSQSLTNSSSIYCCVFNPAQSHWQLMWRKPSWWLQSTARVELYYQVAQSSHCFASVMFGISSIPFLLEHNYKIALGEFQGITWMGCGMAATVYLWRWHHFWSRLSGWSIWSVQSSLSIVPMWWI